MAIREFVKSSRREAVREGHAAVGQDSRVVRKWDGRAIHERSDRQQDGDGGEAVLRGGVEVHAQQAAQSISNDQWAIRETREAQWPSALGRAALAICAKMFKNIVIIVT